MRLPCPPCPVATPRPGSLAGVRVVTVLLLAVAVATAGCGAVDDAKERADRAVAEVRERAGKLRGDLRRLREEVKAEVNRVLADVRRVLPRADEDTEPPQRSDAGTFEGFLDDVLVNVDDYWTTTLTAADIPAPSVRHRWIGPGEVVDTRCSGDPADDMAAFYCPADDTIYIGRALGQQVLQGTGDFGVAYVVAHEYAHNVQAELGWFDEGRLVTTVAPFELQADCMAGAWGHAVYQQGRLQPGDVEEAVATALAVGDFDSTNPQHHGTPEERKGAWLSGYGSGDPSSCREFTR